MGRQLKTTCLKCHSEVTLDFGDVNYSQAKKLVRDLDKRPMECPGFHVELGSWRYYWQLDKMIEEGYTQEEKQACPDTVKEIHVKLLGSSDPNREHIFKTEHEVKNFLYGFSEHNEDNLASLVDVTYYNFMSDDIGGFVLTVKQAIALIQESGA